MENEEDMVIEVEVGGKKEKEEVEKSVSEFE